MPLNEREQKILEEIERQFREEEPELVRAANKLPFAKFAVGSVKLLIVGVIAGLGVMLATFSFNTILALVGFVIMVASATGLVQAIRGTKNQSAKDLGDDGSVDSSRNRWPFRR